MRKWIWSGTALLVFSCAAMYLAAQHAAEHPNSVAARFLRGASTVGMRCNPLLAIVPANLPEPPPRAVDKPVCQPICTLPDPVAVAEQPVVALPAIGEAVDAPEVSEPIVVESEPPPAGEEPVGAASPAEGPLTEEPSTANSIAEEPVEEPEAVSPPRYGETTPVSAEPEPQTDPSAPQPTADEGPTMPYISDDSDEFEEACMDDLADRDDTADGYDGACGSCGGCNGRIVPNMACCCSSCVMRMLKVMCCGEDCPECAKTLGEIIAEFLSEMAGQEEAADDEATVVDDAADNPADAVEDAPADEDTTPDASAASPGEVQAPMNQQPVREDPYYHHHYPSCPYTGRCPYPYHYNVPRVPVETPRLDKQAEDKQAEEQSIDESAQPARPVPPVEPMKKKKFIFLFIGDEASECQPGVDTMECRPSDLHGEICSPF